MHSSDWRTSSHRILPCFHSPWYCSYLDTAFHLFSVAYCYDTDLKRPPIKGLFASLCVALLGTDVTLQRLAVVARHLISGYLHGAMFGLWSLSFSSFPEHYEVSICALPYASWCLWPAQQEPSNQDDNPETLILFSYIDFVVWGRTFCPSDRNPTNTLKWAKMTYKTWQIYMALLISINI